ncbi:LolA-like outer membrane lipoprotein chaperone [Helicobacter sp. 11S03491-1]|uniref:LolA-like outer membrane lipoprotein chaperone n=1 Tax=Helicobacter sp. 11S03491-1 TaxID=1476196 RepID=UPI000BA7D893|nr:LolA-like outer membrane lipoprotein chaperone [Helicobacter sp. 11S03491-1]PAF43390.1 hypothetical protein BKH45_01765 [Helicobacter sp. 11S03491-1]
MKILIICLLFMGNVYGLGDDIKSFRANFIQNVQGENGDKITYQGSIEAKIPNLAKWIYKNPLEKEIYINGEDVVVYEPKLYQATISHLKEKTDFFSILNNAVADKEGKYHSKIGKTIYWLTFKDKKPYLLEFQDDFDNKVSIKFTKVLINQPIEDSDFVFIPKEGIDIIEQ